MSQAIDVQKHVEDMNKLAARDSDDTESMDARVRVELLTAFILSTPKNLWGGLVAALIMAVIATRKESSILPWIWFALISIGLLYGIHISRRFFAGHRAPSDVLKMGRRCLGVALYCAPVWGLVSWWMMASHSVMYDAFMVTAIALVLMGASGTQAVYRTCTVAFTLTTVVVFVAGLLRTPDEFHLLSAVGISTYAAVILMFSRTQENSARRQIELTAEKDRLLRVAEEARSVADMANRAKTAFLAAASHDLRQPMHALVQYVGYLRGQNKDAQLVDTVDRITKSLDAMQDLFDAILDMSKIVAGSVKPTISSVDIANILDRLDVQLRPLAIGMGLQFSIERSDPAAIIETDPVLLERILRNLLLNAIRYTKVGKVMVRCIRKAAFLQCQVWDTGIGIPRSELARIYEAFYQVGNKARDHKKGLGLGLAIVQQLSELLGCRIRVRSVVGKGSVFVVDVPISKNGAASDVFNFETKTALTPDYVRGAFIVLIDDNRDSREATAYTLRTFGCRLISATSSVDALVQLRDQELPPQMIVCDYRLEGESGLDAIAVAQKTLKSLYGNEFSIPAILVSGDTSPIELNNVNRSGFKMLHKPVALGVLYDELNNALAESARVVDN